MGKQSLLLFEKTVRELLHHPYRSIRHKIEVKEKLVEIYQAEQSKAAKKKMILSLYRILLTECDKRYRNQHAYIAVMMDHELTGIKIHDPQ